MQALRAVLTDLEDQALAEVEVSIDPASGPARKGRFEFADSGALIQDILDGKSFGLNFEDGTQLRIRVSSASAGPKPGYSTADFSTV
jgi:hypothetical protein